MSRIISYHASKHDYDSDNIVVAEPLSSDSSVSNLYEYTYQEIENVTGIYINSVLRKYDMNYHDECQYVFVITSIQSLNCGLKNEVGGGNFEFPTFELNGFNCKSSKF